MWCNRKDKIAINGYELRREKLAMLLGGEMLANHVFYVKEGR